MLLTSRDIVNKTFTQIGSRGYDAEEVDNFLDELIVTLDNYSKKVTAMSANLDRAEREVESLKKQVEEHASAAAEASELVNAPAGSALAFERGKDQGRQPAERHGRTVRSAEREGHPPRPRRW